MVYDDEKLSPSAFEQMAREYAKNRQKACLKLFDLFDEILCIKNSLKVFKLNSLYSQKLDNICKNTDVISSFMQKNNHAVKDKKINNNYCALLVMLINKSIDARKMLDKNLGEDEIKDALDEITRTSASMFGVCRYRKLQ